MKRRFSILAALTAAVAALFATGARADTDSATHYYLSLGDSLAASTQPSVAQAFEAALP